MENKELYLYKRWNKNDSAVVCAESKEEASKMHLICPENIQVKFLGVASVLIKKGVILSSYNG